MRCQYCGKRLPLFRKLKDGEFCSTAHREQYIAQADQLATQALREQRERSLRLRTSSSVSTSVPTADGGFSDRYLSTPPAAMPLRQLAGVALAPTPAQVKPFLPEHSPRVSMEEERGTPEAIGPQLQSRWDAERVLRTLSEFGAPVEPLERPEQRGESQQAEQKEPAPPAMARSVALGQPVLLNPPCPQTSTAPQHYPGPSTMAGPRLSAQPDAAHLPRAVEATRMAGRVSEAGTDALSMMAISKVGVTYLGASGSAPIRGAGPAMVTRQAVRPSRSAKNEREGWIWAPLEAVAVVPVTSTQMVGLVAAVVRFPALRPTFSMMPPRPRAALCLAPASWASPPYSDLHEKLNPPVTNVSLGGSPAPHIGPIAYSEVAIGAMFGGLTVDGKLADLLPQLVPADRLAPARPIRWRVEAQVPPPFHTLAVRACAPVVTMRMPLLAVTGVGPRRSDRQVMLYSTLRQVRLAEAAVSDSVSFHLEPQLRQPRLRVQPDPARQGVGVRGKGRNQADAAVSSIKIPVLRRFWAHAPADIRWVALIIPLVFFLAWYSWTPNGKALNQQGKTADLQVDTSGVQSMLASFKSRISSRAAVELSEDFRAGLAEWQGAREDWAANWAYDQAGFVRPGSLAIFTPTATLTDYNFEFLGQIESRGMSWVYRAKDTRNYYQGKLVIVQSGPVPGIAFVRTVVKNGRETQRKVIPLTMNLRADTLYRVRVDVNGSDFTTSVLGQVVDTFSDSAHTQGGIGFLGGSGETSRIRWVEVSHQYDTIGRLCAMLVPYGMPAPGMASSAAAAASVK